MGWQDDWRVEIPTDGPVTPELASALRNSDFHPDLLRELPVDGPWDERSLIRLADAGFGPAVDFTRRLPIDGPHEVEALVEFADVGFDRSLDAILAVQGDGPMSLEECRRIARAAANAAGGP